jgi:hypothetical protein
MKILNFFIFLWVILALLDPDLDPATQINADPCGSGSGYGSGSKTLLGTKYLPTSQAICNYIDLSNYRSALERLTPFKNSRSKFKKSKSYIEICPCRGLSIEWYHHSNADLTWRDSTFKFFSFSGSAIVNL